MSQNESSRLEHCEAWSIGILMVATNDYIERWKSTAADLEKWAFLKNRQVFIHLFTNRDEEARTWASKELSRIELQTHRIKGWGWPEATLFRYQFFSQHKDSITQEFLMYLDSDMQVTRDFSGELFSEIGDETIIFVTHPGFFRSKGVRFIKDLLLNPKLAGPHFAKLAGRYSNIGSWEENGNSNAYVSKDMRSTYVHGAVWFGKRNEFLQMCEELSQRVQKDLDNGFIAIWHDESHLNWFSSTNKSKILTSKYSAVRRYKHNRVLRPAIFTVEKNKGEGRLPTNFEAGESA